MQLLFDMHQNEQRKQATCNNDFHLSNVNIEINPYTSISYDLIVVAFKCEGRLCALIYITKRNLIGIFMTHIKKSSYILALVLPFSFSALAEEVKVAVAANFSKPVAEIAKSFEQDTGNKLIVSPASTGKLYVQVKNGAPFEVFLSADNKTPKKLLDESYAVAGTEFTYAKGKLVLWSGDAEKIKDDDSILRQASFKHLAVANPKTAPYGAAAYEVMEQLKLTDTLKEKLVQGENIAQTKQFVESGNAELGFVALSQVFKNSKLTSGSMWEIPTTMYSPILQDAVLLKAGEKNAAAKAFLDYLKSEKAKTIIQGYGYVID